MRYNSANQEFANDFTQCLYTAETEEEFGGLWTDMITKYSLTENDWLKKLYALREKWAPVYGRTHFCAGMTTTQRSESVNSFVKGYVNRTLCINDFIMQYDKAVSDWREKEIQADFYCRQTKPPYISALRFEYQAAKIYTRRVFRIFQDKLKKISCYIDHIEDENELVAVHKVEMLVPVKSDKDRRVSFDKKENKIECSCNGFQFTGILCIHALRVLLSRRILEIPSHYFLNRWTMHAKDGLILDNLGTPVLADCNKSSSVRYSDLAYRALVVAMKGSADEESCCVVKRHLAACIEELNACQEKITQETTKIDESEYQQQIRKEKRNIDGAEFIEGQDRVQDPPVKKKQKGEQNSGWLSAFEKSIQKKSGTHKKSSKKDNQVQKETI